MRGTKIMPDNENITTQHRGGGAQWYDKPKPDMFFLSLRMNFFAAGFNIQSIVLPVHLHNSLLVHHIYVVD